MRGADLNNLDAQVVKGYQLGEVSIHITTLHHLNRLLFHGGVLVFQLVHGSQVLVDDKKTSDVPKSLPERGTRDRARTVLYIPEQHRE